MQNSEKLKLQYFHILCVAYSANIKRGVDDYNSFISAVISAPLSGATTNFNLIPGSSVHSFVEQKFGEIGDAIGGALLEKYQDIPLLEKSADAEALI